MKTFFTPDVRHSRGRRRAACIVAALAVSSPALAIEFRDTCRSPASRTEAPAGEILFFAADWCGPCRTLNPIIQDLARDYRARVRFTTIDVDQDPTTAANCGIMSIPVLILFKDGKPVAQTVGFAPAAKLRQFIDPHVAPGGAR